MAVGSCRVCVDADAIRVTQTQRCDLRFCGGGWLEVRPVAIRAVATRSDAFWFASGTVRFASVTGDRLFRRGGDTAYATPGLTDCTQCHHVCLLEVTSPVLMTTRG